MTNASLSPISFPSRINVLSCIAVMAIYVLSLVRKQVQFTQRRSLCIDKPLRVPPGFDPIGRCESDCARLYVEVVVEDGRPTECTSSLGQPRSDKPFSRGERKP